jgi:GDPmannose 4,6-dehydratase
MHGTGPLARFGGAGRCGSAYTLEEPAAARGESERSRTPSSWRRGGSAAARAPAAARIARGQEQELVIGNLEAQVDWGFAGDYVEAMVRMLEAPVAGDFVVASGQLHRVRDFVQIAFDHLGLDWRKHVRQSTGVHQPVAAAVYHGDISAIRQLGWAPRTSFEDMVRQMVDAAAD